MTTINAIVSKLRQYPAVKYSISGRTITVEAASEEGFSVWLTEKNPGFTVGYDGWHEEFENQHEALDAFAFGLSEDCRLKVVRRGHTDCAWTVESKDEDDGQWTGDSTTALLVTPFWRKQTIIYRQNHFITSPEEKAL